MKILAFAGSNSSTSINHILLEIVKKGNPNLDIELLDIRNINLPIYNIDIEKAEGPPESLKDLIKKIKSFDAIILSIPEHNGLPSAFFKNIIDWCSRIDSKFLGNKQAILLSTSPGSQGGANNLEKIAPLFKYWGAEITGTYSVPMFYDAVDPKTMELEDAHNKAIRLLLSKLYVLN